VREAVMSDVVFMCSGPDTANLVKYLLDARGAADFVNTEVFRVLFGHGQVALASEWPRTVA
jgi:hypothetical protein